jgi:hypothetical protein
MLVNKDETRPHQVKVVFGDSEGKDVSFSGKVFQATFGSEQYVWKDDGENSHADPDGPPVSTTVTVSPKTIFTLPKASITVLRGKIER